MKINIKKTFDSTPALQTYIEQKLMPLAKFVKRYDDAGTAEIWLELSRTTQHQKKGEVFFVAADLRLPHKILRAEARATDVRKAIDEVRDILRQEIEKYKAKFLEPRRERER